MTVKYKIEGGKLVFENLELNGSNKIDWDEIRQIALIGTRFEQKRPLAGRPPEEVEGMINKYLSQRDSANDAQEDQIKELERKLANANSMIRSLEDQVSHSNIQANEWRIKFAEAARALQAQG